MASISPISYTSVISRPDASRGGTAENRAGSADPTGQTAQGDVLTLSAEGRQRAAAGQPAEGSERPPEGSPAAAEASATLTEAELKELRSLKSRDQEVRTHEQAHLSAAGQYAAGGASFSYQKGPDGNKYAVGGEVPIDISPEKTPEETVRKMQVVKKAALAPASPSAADRQIAAQASMAEAQARQEMLKEGQQQLNELLGESSTAGGVEAPAENTRNAAQSLSDNQSVSVTRRAMIAAYTAAGEL